MDAEFVVTVTYFTSMRKAGLKNHCPMQAVRKRAIWYENYSYYSIFWKRSSSIRNLEIFACNKFRSYLDIKISHVHDAYIL